MSEQIGKIGIVPVREAFKREALDFTTWLEQNIDALTDRLGLELSVLEREKTVGSFNVDLLCEDDAGRLVIIENQLERTDHDHLGKILTYLVNLEASSAIWVTPEVRPEHERVIEWLNETTGTDITFYLVRVEAVRIGDSPFAPLFTVLAGPDEETKQVGETKKDWSERHQLRLEFWTELVERVRERKIALFANIKPSRDHWLSTGAGRGGVVYSYLIWKDGAGIELYIDTGNYDTNKVIFDALFAQRDEIEREFGEPLNWQRLDNRRASRVMKRWDDRGNLTERDKWDELQETLIAGMTQLEHVLKKRLQQIKV